MKRRGFHTPGPRWSIFAQMKGQVRGAFQVGRFVLLSVMAKHDPDLSLIFQALADPTRRAMLAHIGRDVVAVSTLAQPTGLALPTVLRHLAVLEAAALISSQKTGRTRYCRAVPATLAATMDWLAGQRAVWEARTDRLEVLAMTLVAKDT